MSLWHSWLKVGLLYVTAQIFSCTILEGTLHSNYNMQSVLRSDGSRKGFFQSLSKGYVEN